LSANVAVHLGRRPRGGDRRRGGSGSHSVMTIGPEATATTMRVVNPSQEIGEDDVLAVFLAQAIRELSRARHEVLVYRELALAAVEKTHRQHGAIEGLRASERRLT